jgi:hypothetical protein
MISIVTLVAASVALVALAALLWQIATRRTIRVSVVGAVAGAFGGVFFSLEPVKVALAGVTGVTDASRLIAHVCVLFAGYCSQAVFASPGPDRSTQRRHRTALIVFALGVVVLTACVAIDPRAVFEASHANRPAVAVYLLAFLTFVGLTVAGVAWQAHRRANALKQARQDPESISALYLRIGMRVLSFIGPVGGAYVVSKAAYLSAAILGWTIPSPR